MTTPEWAERIVALCHSQGITAHFENNTVHMGKGTLQVPANFTFRNTHVPIGCTLIFKGEQKFTVLAEAIAGIYKNVSH